jgi:hypothetical protein
MYEAAIIKQPLKNNDLVRFKHHIIDLGAKSLKARKFVQGRRSLASNMGDCFVTSCL